MILKFEVFDSFVDSEFWDQLGTLKMNEWKLDDSERLISASYRAGRKLIKDEQRYGLPCRFIVEAASLISHSPGLGFAPGVIKNTNTLPDFKSLDKNKFQLDILDSILDGSALKNPSILTKFGLITYADLKKYKFYYWFTFPALLPSTPFIIPTPVVKLSSVFSVDQQESFFAGYEIFKEKMPDQASFFWVRITAATISVGPLSSWIKSSESSIPIFGFIDPSGAEYTPGWPLRNFLTLLQNLGLDKVEVVGLREQHEDCILITVNIGSSGVDIVGQVPSAVGWENGTKGGPAPRVMNLAPIMDPKHLANTAVDLNLKLMRWRILPALDLTAISSCECLLIGAGTLGCYVGRILMAWGVRKITFVDNGKVSFSNPVRQPLFRFEDCLDGGAPKASAAANALSAVFPGVSSVGHDLSIPMPGHFVDSDEKTMERIDLLKALIESHDAIFLLTDSRESRWLPTLLGAASKKIVINTALGFDTFLVMRHGVRDLDSPPTERLGCYFCNDVVAPVDSLTDRTLDQQCTVTRPGLSGIASAIAVELLASILNHPNGARANADTAEDAGGSVLGVVPHQVRGFLAQFRNMILKGMGYDKCTACSDAVLKAYRDGGNEFLLEALKSPAYLERVAGLEQMKKEVEEEVDFEWDDEEGGCE